MSVLRHEYQTRVRLWIAFSIVAFSVPATVIEVPVGKQMLAYWRLGWVALQHIQDP
jgi:hypothetical protein